MPVTATITEKIQEIIAELKQQGMWKKEPPPWVTHYGKHQTDPQDFEGWLQFVFLPNCLPEVKSNTMVQQKNYIVLQAKRFLEGNVHRGRLLQLLIELDALF